MSGCKTRALENMSDRLAPLFGQNPARSMPKASQTTWNPAQLLITFVSDSCVAGTYSALVWVVRDNLNVDLGDPVDVAQGSLPAALRSNFCHFPKCFATLPRKYCFI